MKVLDCTLRDGGYINNWKFGDTVIDNIIRGISLTNVDYMEIGFIRNAEYSPDSAVFNRISQAALLIPKPIRNALTFVVMADFADLIPMEAIEPYQQGFPSMIRVLIWKQKRDRQGTVHDALREGYDYCKGLIEKGYKVSLQPTRTNQYSEEEFLDFLHMFTQLDIFSIYVADSWGNMTTDEVIHYMNMIDCVAGKGISIGYHGHDNQMRAEKTVSRILETHFNHEIIIDASIDGIGKGGGNLKLQSLCKLVHDKTGRNFDIGIMNRLSDKYIEKIYEQHAWGGEAFAITGKYNCNPYYADYYLNEQKLSVCEIERIVLSLSDEDKIMFSREKAFALMKKALSE